MALFDIPNRPNRSVDSGIVKKAATKVKTTTTVKGGSSLISKISRINTMVLKNLGKYESESVILSTIDALHEYIDKCIKNNVISVDTETTGLDPILDKIVGVCIYTPGEKTAYIPINHISYITEELLPNQLKQEEVAKELQRIVDNNVNVIMFNAPFDIRVLRNQLGVYMTCKWDCYLGARLMNENEPSNQLKKLHQKYVLKGEEDAFTFDDLFKGITFDKIPIKTGYLYAAHDAIITYELYQFQKQYLYYEEDKPYETRNGMNGVSWVFENIEMPIVDVVCDMEDSGMEFDMKFSNELSAKYHSKLNDILVKFNSELINYQKLIDDYTSKTINCKLDNPINIASSTQLAILFYDILKIEPPDPKSPRGTGVEILSKIENPLAKIILEYREVAKLLSTYIDKLPDCVNSKTGRIHCKFNQYGADTGRFSSNDPNMQNLPHNELRKMFKAKDGYVLLSSDFSSQEPKTLAALCRKNGDSQMYDTFMAGKDLYSEIASKSFHVPYEECLEFASDGSKNPPEYKVRRTKAKSILLGALYGRGVPSIAEQLNCSIEEAQDIKNSVFKAFPAIKKFEDDSLQMAQDLGYVTTICGRKRRLPDLQLPEFEFKWQEGFTPEGDILDFDDVDVEVPEDRIKYYLKKLSTIRYGAKRQIFEEANKEHIWIIDNGGKIADSTRQCVNARIQGGAADLTKLAMIKLNTNSRLNELGFKLLVPVHDEVICECPRDNVKECAKLLAETMSKAAEEILEMPIKCDVECSKEWYGESIEIGE